MSDVVLLKKLDQGIVRFRSWTRSESRLVRFMQKNSLMREVRVSVLNIGVFVLREPLSSCDFKSRFVMNSFAYLEIRDFY